MKIGVKTSVLKRLASVVASAALLAAGLAGSPASANTYPYYPACTIQGTEADETLNGTYGNDVICTGGGNDIVNAGAGDDIVIAENGGSVVVDLGTGNDIFDGTNGSDAVVDGGDGDDELTGTPGADELNGQEGDDSLLAGASNDRLNGGAGADALAGQTGNDYLMGEAGDDTIDGGSGTDDIYGGSENDVLVGGSEGDTIHGGDGNDNLVGDAGNDDLFGESGIDSLNGGDGDDVVAGGDGVDMLDGGWGLNACDHTATEPLTSTCTYDDDAPVISNFSFDRSSYEVGVAAAEVVMTFDITDPSGVEYMSIVCWGNDTASYPVSISINRQDTRYNISGSVNSETSFEYSGDSKNLHVVAKTKIPFGAKPGRYDCNYYGHDMANHPASRWVQIANLDVTRQSGTYDDDAPVISNFSFDRSSYEVGVAAAEVVMTFDITDPSGVEYMSIVCWGNDTASYPVSISINRQDTRYNISGSVNSETSFEYSGDSKNLHVVAKTKIPFGAKPGRYDCNYYGHDMANHPASRWVQIANLDVFRTPAGMPSAPTNLQLTQDRAGRGVLSWDAPARLGSPNLRDYVIQVSEDGTNWKTIEDGYSTTTNLPVSNLKTSTDYWFRVRGENGGAAGQNTAFMTLAWSDLQVRTMGATAPFAVQSLTASERTKDGFKVSWTEPVFNGGEQISNFVIEVSTDNGSTWRSAKATESTSLSYRVGGAAPGTTYLVRVAATNKIGTGDYATTTITTLATVAKEPTNLKVTNLALRSLSLGWSLPASNGGSPILDYKIEFSSNAGATWNEITHVASASRSFNVTGLLRGKAYLFRVAAINEIGVGASTAAVSATTLLAPATAPQSFTSTSGTNAAQFSWQSPADNGGASVTAYRVEYSKDGLTWVTLAARSTSASFKLSGLTPGSTYQVRVAAITRAGLGAFLTEALTTATTVASAPGQLRAIEISQTSLTLAWSLPALNGGASINDYQVEVSANGGANWKVVPHEAANNLSIQVTGLPSGTTRLFRVAAVNEVGIGAYSTQISATTLGYRPSAPTKLRVISRGATSVSIAWNQEQALGGSPVRNFVIEFSKDGGSTWLTAKSAVTKAQSSTISGFKSGTNYKIRVRAVNDVGSSAASTFVSVTTR